MEQVTIIIPVHNNHHNFLNRLLEYYLNYSFKILIADSSPIKYKGNIINKNAVYYHFPSFGLTEKIVNIISLVTSPYVVICAVDDFIIPEAILTCKDFLEKNKNYSCVQGHVVSFFYAGKKIITFPSFIQGIGMDFFKIDPTERLIDFFSNKPSIFYSIRRTSVMKEIYTLENNWVKNDFLGEFISEIGTLASGNFKTLPIFYSVRESTTNSSSHIIPSISTLSSNPIFKEEYNLFLDISHNFLTNKIEFFKNKNARPFINHLIELYCKFQNGLMKKNINYFDNPSKISFIKNFLNRLPFLGKLIVNKYNEWIGSKRLQWHFEQIVKDISGFPYKDPTNMRELKEIERLINKHSIK